MLATVCFCSVIGILFIRLDMFAEYGVEALDQQPETEATVKSWDRTLWIKMKTRMKTPESSDVANDMSLMEWRNKIYTMYGPKMQVIVSTGYIYYLFW